MDDNGVMIRHAETDTEIDACFSVMSQLHETLNRERFTDDVRRMEDKNGYHLVYLSTGGDVKVVAGLHFGESFGWKNYLYVDDLVSDSASRGQGYGARMMSWLYDYARTHDCDQLHLDSRVTRYATHKFYLNRGLYIGGYHFLTPLGDEAE